MMREEFLPIPGYEGKYHVSNQGRVYSVPRTTPDGRSIRGTMLTPWTRQGYAKVALSNGGLHPGVGVHVLVAAAFNGPCPPGMEVNHKNGDKSDNRPENLEYVTHSENLCHAYATGLKEPIRGEQHVLSKLTTNQIIEIRRLRAMGKSLAELAQQFNVTDAHISKIVNRKRWKHVS